MDAIHTVLSLHEDPDPERYAGGVLPWVHEAGNPYFDWIFGGPDRASEVLAKWVRRRSSEVSMRRAVVALHDDRVVGGFIALDGAELARCRQADLMSLITQLGSDKALESRLTASQGLFARVEPDDFYLSKIGVQPEFRGHGVAKELMRLYSESARQRGLPRLRLEVSATNTAAVRLYESLGFETAGRSAVPTVGLEYLDMTKAIA